MSLSKDSQRGDIFIGNQPTPGKPKGFLNAYSEIQQYYLAEKTTGTISVDFLTLEGKLAFFEVGFKGGFLCGFISALLTPVAFGVIDNYLPIFGSYDPNWYDKFFAFVLACGFAVGYGFLFSSLGKYYIGEVSKAAIKNLVMGLAIGAVIKLIIVFLAFHFIYIVILEPNVIGAWLIKMTWLTSYDRLNGLFQWLMVFRPVFLVSAYFVLFTTLLMITIPILGIHLGAKRSKKRMDHQEDNK